MTHGSMGIEGLVKFIVPNKKVDAPVFLAVTLFGLTLFLAITTAGTCLSGALIP
jgi:hypothetical protein